MEELTRLKIVLSVEEGMALIEVGDGYTSWVPLAHVMALLQTPFDGLALAIWDAASPVDAAILKGKLTSSRC